MTMLTLRMAILGCGVILKVTTYTGGFIGPIRKLLIYTGPSVEHTTGLGLYFCNASIRSI